MDRSPAFHAAVAARQFRESDHRYHVRNLLRRSVLGVAPGQTGYIITNPNHLERLLKGGMIELVVPKIPADEHDAASSGPKAKKAAAPKSPRKELTDG